MVKLIDIYRGIQYIDEDSKTTKVYAYRAIREYIGDTVVFTPDGHYEGMDDDNNPIYNSGVFKLSNDPETAASKYIGGAVLGANSVNKFGEHKANEPLFIYSISEEPDKDISHWSLQDFEYLQEVRYRRPVTGKFIGKVVLSDDVANLISQYYDYMAWNEENTDYGDEEFPEELEMIADIIMDGKFRTLINRIRIDGASKK